MKDFRDSFRAPLALALAGGGAHGAWQAGALKALTGAGLTFREVLGFSAGALTATGYALDLEGELEARWRRVDEDRILRLAPRLGPLSLFSGEPVWAAARPASDGAARPRLRCELTIVSLRVPQGEYDYARFSPGGARWDGPMDAKLVASCAIPGIFPPVEVPAPGGSQRLVDGGVPGRGWMRFDALASPKDVVVLQMTRPEEMGRLRVWPWARFDQAGREVCHLQMSSGIASLLERPDPPRVFRLFPSRPLPFSMLSFRARDCVPGFELGLADGRRFLEGPAEHLVTSVVVPERSSGAPIRYPRPAVA